MGNEEQKKGTSLQWATLIIVIFSIALEFFFNVSYNSKIQGTTVLLNQSNLKLNFINEKYITLQNQILEETKETKSLIEKLTAEKINAEKTNAENQAFITGNGFNTGVKSNIIFEPTSSTSIACNMELSTENKVPTRVVFCNIKVFSANTSNNRHITWHTPFTNGQIKWKLIYESTCDDHGTGAGLRGYGARQKKSAIDGEIKYKACQRVHGPATNGRHGSPPLRERITSPNILDHGLSGWL